MAAMPVDAKQAGVMRIISAFIALAAAACLGCGSALAGPVTQSAAAVRLDLLVPDLSSQFVESPADPELDANLPSLDYLDPESALWKVAMVGTPLEELQDLSADKMIAISSTPIASDVRLQVATAVERPDMPVLSDLDQLQLSEPAEPAGSRRIIANADWSFASWGSLSVLGSLGERSGPDFFGPVHLQVPGEASAGMVGVAAHLMFGDGWVTSFSYDEGRTQFDLQPNGLSVQEGHGFSMAVSKKGIFDDDTLGIAVIRPPTETGFGLLTSGNDSRLLGSQISLSSATPETDFELGYETSFNGNITLQANAAYQVNVAGQNGTKAVTVLSRAKINF